MTSVSCRFTACRCFSSSFPDGDEGFSMMLVFPLHREFLLEDCRPRPVAINNGID